MKTLGIGWTVQDAMYNSGDAVLTRERGGRASHAAGGDGEQDRRRPWIW
ncbi:MAG: hypothetical protein IIA27_13410 [Gemmatimonadetes bacterium]|nr:hypothetical protein [Gemmatimonadota bacterium]